MDPLLIRVSSLEQIVVPDPLTTVLFDEVTDFENASCWPESDILFLGSLVCRYRSEFCPGPHSPWRCRDGNDWGHGRCNSGIDCQTPRRLWLDQSLFTQLYTHIWKMMRGDFGISFTHRVPVRDLILDHLPATILLVTTAFFLALITGTILGIIAAQKPKHFVSHVVTVLSLSGFSAPIFWTGLMLLIVFGYLLPLFPASGMKTPGFQGTGMEKFVDVLKHLVLPAVTLASVYIAVYSRLARASMLDVLGSDYIRTARSKGLSRRVVVYKHALKNGILPVVTMAGLQFSQLVAGAVVVETVFSWPGIGQLAFNAILRRDHPLLLGILFFSTLMVVVANLITDSSYRLLDPRIK